MKLKKLRISWSVSLFVIGIATSVLAWSNIIGIEFDDTIIRIIGIINLLALPVLVFTTVKLHKKK
jgi:hypothetical protein